MCQLVTESISHRKWFLSTSPDSEEDVFSPSEGRICLCLSKPGHPYTNMIPWRNGSNELGQGKVTPTQGWSSLIFLEQNSETEQSFKRRRKRNRRKKREEKDMFDTPAYNLKTRWQNILAINPPKSVEIQAWGTCLMAQWLRLDHPMQGCRFDPWSGS